MSMAYQGWSAEKLLQQFRTSQDRYRHLFDSYIERMLNRPSRGQSERVQYPKEKVLHWLSWLAKTMVNESKTVFLIEKMQPSLLQSKSEKRSYLIRTFSWGGLIASRAKEITLFEQINWSWHSAKSKFVRQMTLGVIIGLILGLMLVGISFYEWRENNKHITINPTDELNSNYYESYIAELNQKKAEQKNKMSKAQNAELKAFYQNKLEQTNNELNQLNHDRSLFEDEEFKEEKLNQDLSLFEELRDWWSRYPIGKLLLIPVLIGGLIGGINSGFNSKEMKQRTLPNQGIWSSGKSALRTMVIVALIVAPIGGAISELITKKHIDFELQHMKRSIFRYDQEINKIEKIILKVQNADVKVDLQKRLRKKKERTELMNYRYETYKDNTIGDLVLRLLNGELLFGGLFGGLFVGLIFGLLNGGAACIQHYQLRRILYRQGRIPWNYARFLDYATERLLMKKVGGGYVFYHRMLMEHFAQRHAGSSESIDKSPQMITQVATDDRQIAVNSSNNSGTTNQLSNMASNSLTCDNCGQQNSLSNKFCSQCGSQLTKSS